MSKGREISDYLDDIITAIADVAEFTQGMSYDLTIPNNCRILKEKGSFVKKLNDLL